MVKMAMMSRVVGIEVIFMVFSRDDGWNGVIINPPPNQSFPNFAKLGGNEVGVRNFKRWVVLCWVERRGFELHPLNGDYRPTDV